ncbi:MAG: hypothetical protein ACXVW0_11945 [Nocardioides sp.]
MRHRSPRPFLDRLRSPVLLRRGALAAGAVAALGTATGFALTSGGEAAPAQGSSVTRADAPRTAVSPTDATADRAPEPTRSSPRTAVPPAPTPAPQAPKASPTRSLPALPTQVPSVSAPSTSLSVSGSTAPSTSSSQSRSRTASPSQSPSSSPSPDDSTPPQTTAQTESLVGAVWTLVFGANEPATFTCSLDGGAWEACPATDVVTLTSSGPHSLAVRATDAAGNTDATPAYLSVKLSGPSLD